MTIEIYTDRYGDPRVNCPKSLEALAWYLEQDIQKSRSCCDRMLQIIESVQQGKQELWEGTGNAHTVTVGADMTTIFNEFSDILEPCSMPTSEFKNAVIAWRQLIKESCPNI